MSHKRNWAELLNGFQARSLTVSPRLATGDGALYFLECNGKDIPEHAAPTCC
ncbi:MAG: hypothetical protein ACTS73_00215 [Arsenophonus sp. NEOnobi-MAG3]